MTLPRHALILVLALALAALPGASAVASPRAVIVFHPEGPGDRPELSLGLLGATQGPYSIPQALLDLSQGNRISRSGYTPADPPRLALVGQGIAGWDAAVRRAATAPAEIRPGLLASFVPGGAGYVGAGVGGRRPHVEAIVAADGSGTVAETFVGTPRELTPRIREMLGRRRLVVVALARGPDADRTVDALLDARGSEDLVLVIRTPPVVEDAHLLPVGLVAGRGRTPGLLRSRTTRRDGLIAGHDVLPTVLAHLGVRLPDGVRGRPVTVTTARGRDVAYLGALERRLRAADAHRYPALRAFAAAMALLLLAGVLARRRARALRTAGLAVLWLPLVTLATAALAPARTAELLLVALLPAALGALTDRLVAWPRAPAVPALTGVLAYGVDLALGSPLIVRSLLGPNPRFGARWYGIGNELEALLPGLLLVGLAAALGAAARSRRLALTVGGAMALLGAVVGAGRLGADVGGVVTIGAAGAAAVLLCLPGRPSRRAIALACAAPVVAVLALAGLDLVTGGDAHLTTTVLGADDASALGNVIERRASLALDSSVRGLIPIAALLSLVLVVLGVRQRARLFGPVAGRPAWIAALAGSVAGGVVGSAANDSGPLLLVIGVVVLAATTAYVANPPAEA